MMEGHMKKTGAARLPADIQPFLQVVWKDEENTGNILSSITFAFGDNVYDSCVYPFLAKRLTSDNKASLRLVGHLYKCFHARLVTVAFCPVTFILRHKTIADVKHLAEKRNQLKKAFRQFMPQHPSLGKVEMRVKLLTELAEDFLSPTLTRTFDPKSQTISNSDCSSPVVGFENELIEGRFESIRKEIYQQRCKSSMQFQKRKKQHADIMNTLSILTKALRAQPKEGKPIKESYDDMRYSKENSRGINESKENEETVTSCSLISNSEILHGTLQNISNGNEVGKTGKQDIVNSLESGEVANLRGRNMTSTEDGMPVSKHNTTMSGAETGDVSSGRHADETVGINSQRGKAKPALIKKQNKVQSSSTLYPISSNDFKRKDSENMNNQFGLSSLVYICSYQTTTSPEGKCMIRRTTNYTLSNGDEEDNWSRVIEYEEGNQAPSIFEDLPYGLAPITAPTEVPETVPYDVISRSPSDLERILLRLHPTITKEQHSTLDTDHAAKCVLNYLRTIIGQDDPVWQLADEALAEDYTSVIRSPIATDTILCLDNCGTMSREAFLRVKETAFVFLGGIQAVAEEFGLKENIALVTLGSRAQIVHHLSTDYESLRHAVDQTECGGTSTRSYLEGVMVCLAACTKGGVCHYGQYLRVPPRLIFVTDGITVGKTGQCNSESDRIKVMRAIHELGSDYVKENVFSPITVVPHGVTNEIFFKSMVGACKGVVENDITRLCSHQRIQRQIAQIIKFVDSHCGLNRTTAMNLDHVIATLSSSFNTFDRKKIMNTVLEKVYPIKQDMSLTMTFDNINEEIGLPPLGTRVIRGPDWKWANEDCECAGTVVNHAYCKDYLCIMWDSGIVQYYRYGANGNYDVLPVDDHPALPEKEGCIRIGMQVERGPDWHKSYGDQDGGPGGIGIVIRKRTERVMVRWKDGDVHKYRFGEHGKYDLRIRDADESRVDLNEDTTKVVKKHDKGDSSECERKPADVWQWQGKDGTWIAYSQEVNTKLNKTYAQRPRGSCLVQKDGKSFRVSFKTLTEKSIDTLQTITVRRH